MSGKTCGFLLTRVQFVADLWKPPTVELVSPEEIVEGLVERSRLMLADGNRVEAVNTCLRGCAYHPNFLAAFRMRQIEGGWDPSNLEHPTNLWREGESLLGETLLVASLGDASHLFLYAKLIPLLLEKGARKIFFQVPEELCDLFPSYAEVELILDVNDAEGWTKYLPLNLIPIACELDVHAFPKKGYLCADEIVKAGLKQYFSKEVNIGLILPNHLSLEASLALVESLHRFGKLILLQGGSEGLGLDLRSEISGWREKAAALDLCDVVIACDGPEAHLSAALGKPTLVPVRGGAHPLWSQGMLYENAREFRQDRLSDWTKVSSDLYVYFEEQCKEWSQNQ